MRLHKKRILITGASGFIGSHLAEALSVDNEVLVTSRSKKKGAFAFDLATDESKKLRRIGNVDIVVHLAAITDNDLCGRNAERAIKTNVLGTVKLLQFGRDAGIDLFVFASSGGVYGYREGKISEKTPPLPQNVYAMTKYRAELEVMQFSKHFPHVTLRYFFPFGPGQDKKRLIPGLINRIAKKKSIILNVKNKPIINPVYITDAVKATLKACALKESYILNIGGNESADIKKISMMISRIIGVRPLFIHSGKSIKDLNADISAAKRILSFEPKVSLREGLKMCIRDYIKKNR